MGSNLPHTAPIDVELPTFVGDQRIEFGTVGVGTEDYAVAVVVKRIEQNRNRVITRELRRPLEWRHDHDLVALQNPRDDLFGRSVVSVNPDVERGVVEEYQHLGSFGGGISLQRLALAKSGCARSRFPGTLVEEPVDPQLGGLLGG